jgi:hypothetical protein
MRDAIRTDSIDASQSAGSTSRAATRRRPPSDRRRIRPGPRHLAVDLAVRPGSEDLSAGDVRENVGGERGIRTLEGLLTLTPLAGVRLRPLGHLSVLALKVRLSMTYKLDTPSRPCGEQAMILKRIGKGKEEWRASLVRGAGCARAGQTRASRCVCGKGQAERNSAGWLSTGSPCDSPCCSRLMRS